MLTVNQFFSRLPFIRYAESGLVTAAPDLRFCRIEFDTRHYNDGLFTWLRSPMPAMLTKAVVKRRAEYFAGRYAAHMLLQQAGCNMPVLTGISGEPLWPAGWCGALSHVTGSAIALLAPTDSALMPGVDIEHNCPDIMRKTAETFSCQEERALLINSDLPYEQALLVTFSAKESLFKALFPQVQRFFGFDTARVTQLAAHSLTLQLTESLTPALAAGYSITCYYRCSAHQVITLIF